MSIGHSNVHSSIGRTEMSIGHSNVHSPLDKQECPLDIQMSIRPLDIQMSIRPLDKQKCPIHMGSDSIRLRHYSFLGIVNVTCPLDVNKCPFVHCTNRNVHSSIGGTEMSIGHSNVHSSFGGTEMSIGHSNVHSCIGQTGMSIGHSNVHSSIGHSNVYSSIGQTEMSYPYGVRLSQITSLQLSWHCKRYMSIGRK